MAGKPTRQATFQNDPAFLPSVQAFTKRHPALLTALEAFMAHKAERPPRPLPRGMRDHLLGGQLNGLRECHLAGDACLLYADEKGVVTLIEIVDHDTMQGPKGKALSKRHTAYRR